MEYRSGRITCYLSGLTLRHRRLRASDLGYETSTPSRSSCACRCSALLVREMPRFREAAGHLRAASPMTLPSKIFPSASDIPSGTPIFRIDAIAATQLSLTWEL